MNHIKIEQNNIPDNVNYELIESLAEEVTNKQDASLKGTLNTQYVYKDTYEYLTGRFNELAINIGVDQYIRFEDQNFAQTSATVLNTTVPITYSASLTASGNANNILSAVTNASSIVNMYHFPNCTSFYATSQVSSLLHNCYLTVLNLGNIEKIIYGNSMQPYFNIRMADNVIIDTFIAEHLKTICVFGTRGLNYKEAYFPNLEYYGQAPGDSPGQRTIDGVTYNYYKDFTFIGDKLKYWGGLGENNHEELRFRQKCVITALTPPSWASWGDEPPETPSTINQGYSKYVLGSFCYYVPDSVLNDYKQAPIWSQLWSDWGTECLKPISELPNEYKQKISKYYTIPSNN